MSQVTDILLTTSIAESEDIDGVDVYPALAHVNKWLAEKHRCELKPVHPNAGGNKYPQSCVFMAAVNYLDHDGLIAAVWSAPWLEPENVKLMLQREEENTFTVTAGFVSPVRQR